MSAKAKLLWLASLPALLLFMPAPGWVLGQAAAAIVIQCRGGSCYCDDKTSCDKMKKGDWCDKDTISCDEKGTSCGCREPKNLPTLKQAPKVLPKANIQQAE